MANTAAVYARIDPKLKKEVEDILEQLNVSPSSLIQMLYGQIKLTRGIPFEIKLPSRPLLMDESVKDETVSTINSDVPNKKTLKAIENVEKMEKNPDNYQTFKSVDDLMKDLDK